MLDICITRLSGKTAIDLGIKRSTVKVKGVGYVFSSPVGSLCHTRGVVRRPSYVVCRLCPP